MTMNKISRKRLFLILAGVLVGFLLVSLDSTIVSTAMPKIIASLNGMNYYAWPFTAFMLTMTITIPIFGKLSDMYGFKLIYMIGISVFLIGSILCGVSQNMMQMIIFRGIQGIGAGILVSNTMGLIGVLFEPSERAKFLGIASSINALASVVGPALGGFITDNFNWHWIFYVNIPLGAIAMLIIIFALPSSKEFQEVEERKKIDLLGAAALILALVPMLLAFSWGGKDYGWNSVQIIGMLAFSVIMLVVFLVIENKAGDPIVPLAFFKSSIFNVSSIVMFFANASMMGAAIFVPLFAQTVTGVSATNSGVVTTPMMLGLVAGAIISGVIVSKTHKYKVLSILGLIIVGVGNFLLSQMGLKTSNGVIALNMAVTGFGIGIVMPIFITIVQNIFPKNQMGAVSSVIQFFAKMGATIASSILGTIMLNSMTNGFKNLDLSKFPAPIRGILVNPNALSNTKALAQLNGMLPKNMMPALAKLMENFKQIRSNSIHQIFIICIFIVIAALITVVFLKEVPFTETLSKEGNSL